MAKAAKSDELRQGFEEHLEQTKGHVQRLEQVFSSLGEKPTGKKCKGMQGIIEEGQEMINNGDDLRQDAQDAGLISAVQRVEHYEIAAYGSLRTYANLLGDQKAVSLLEETLEEEKKTDQKLTSLAEDINVQATHEAMNEGEEMEEQERERSTGRSSGNGRTRSSRGSRRKSKAARA